MFKGRPKQRDQMEREGARFIASSDLAQLVGSRGAVQGVHSSKPATEVPTVAVSESKSAAYHARQQRKKQRRRERWELQVAERGAMVRDAAVDSTVRAERAVPAGGKRSLTKQERKDLRKAKASPSTRKLKKIYEEQAGGEDDEDGEDGEDEDSDVNMRGLPEHQSDDDEDDDSDEGEGEAEGLSRGGRRRRETSDQGAFRGQREQRSGDASLVERVRRSGGAPGHQATTSNKAEKRKRIKKQKKTAKAAAAAAAAASK